MKNPNLLNFLKFWKNILKLKKNLNLKNGSRHENQKIKFFWKLRKFFFLISNFFFNFQVSPRFFLTKKKSISIIFNFFLHFPILSSSSNTPAAFRQPSVSCGRTNTTNCRILPNTSVRDPVLGIHAVNNRWLRSSRDPYRAHCAADAKRLYGTSGAIRVGGLWKSRWFEKELTDKVIGIDLKWENFGF